MDISVFADNVKLKIETLGEKNMGQITELIQEAHKTAVEHGWWEKEPDFGTLIALCHSELSEALEEYRNGKRPDESEMEMASPLLNEKPVGIPSELADTIIRIFDMCGYYGINLEQIIIQKMEYNQKRPYKHGGKVI